MESFILSELRPYFKICLYYFYNNRKKHAGIYACMYVFINYQKWVQFSKVSPKQGSKSTIKRATNDMNHSGETWKDKPTPQSQVGGKLETYSTTEKDGDEG